MIEKRVLHVVNISFVLPYYIGEQFDYFSSKGITFYVACQPSEHLIKYSEEKKFRFLAINVLREINILQDCRAIFLLSRYIKKEKIDIVISHTPKGGIIGMLSAFLAGIDKRIYFRHGIMYETSKGMKRILLKMVERLTGYLAETVICVSPSVLAYSNNEHLSADYKNLILNKGTCNGIDALNKFNRSNIDVAVTADLKKECKISPKDRVVGFVGRLVNDKGINELISAWQELVKEYSDIKLLLVGPFEDRDSIPEAVKAYICTNPSIVYTGPVDNVVPYYTLMDIFILPSYREGFPTSVLEASAMELPVLTTTATGCCDAIIDGCTGMFIDFNISDIVDKISIYLNSPSLASCHGKKGRDFVLENFQQNKMWDEIEAKIFNSALVMKVAITGSNGFVGRNLSLYLKDSFEIKAISRADLDRMDDNSLDNYVAVIHLAGKAHDLKKSSNPKEYYQVNFELTRMLYDAFLRSSAKKFIFMSSVKAAADSVTGALTEEDKPNPLTDYGKSKLLAEEYIVSQPLPEGKSYYILRPCMIHGPGNKGNLNLLYKFVKKGIPYPLAGFDNRRSFLSVENLCFIIREFIQHNEIPNGIYQAADDEPLSTNQVVTILANAIGVKPKLWKISPKMIFFLAKCCDALHLPLTTERLHKLTESYIVNNDKVKQTLKKELPLTTVDGLLITAKSFDQV